MKGSFLSAGTGRYSRGIRLFAGLAVLCASFLLSSTPVSAVTTVPTTMNFQGRLTDSSGTVLTNGLYNMKFRLFTVSSGGSNVWNETRETTNRVQVTNGLFNVKLGAVTPIPASLFASGSLYFEIELPTPATATCSTASCGTFTEGAMTPRAQLSTSAYAFDSETLDGIDSTTFSRTDAANTFTGTNLFKPTSNTTAIFQIQDATGLGMLTVDANNDRVYIGDTTPDGLGLTLITDTKNTTGDPTSIDGAMYYNSDSKGFRCQHNAVWRDCDFASLRSEWVMREDFIGNSTSSLQVGDQGWAFASTLSGTITKRSVVTDSSDNDRFGILQLNTPATAGAGDILSLDTSGIPSTPTNLTTEFNFASANAAAATGLQQDIKIGLHDSNDINAAADGMYFWYNATTTAGNWQRCTEVTCVDTGVAKSTTANQYQRFKIVVNAAGTSIEFFIDETSVGVVTTNLPGSFKSYGPSINAFTIDATVRQWKIDYFQMKRNVTTLR